jgi:HAD superfamily hydrolase (TIGR01509 family)
MPPEGLRELLEKTGFFIFDFDGVIVDSEFFFYLSAKKALSLYKDLDEDYYYRYWTNIGNGLERELDELHLTQAEEIIIKNSLKKNYLYHVNSGLIKSYKEVKPILNILLDNGKRLYIASNTSTEVLSSLLESNNIPGHYFSGIFGKTPSLRPKPHPDIFLHTLEKTGINPMDAIVVEDTDKGTISAGRAGLKSIAVRSRHNECAEFRDSEYIFQGHGEFLSWLQNNIALK